MGLMTVLRAVMSVRLRLGRRSKAAAHCSSKAVFRAWANRAPVLGTWAFLKRKKHRVAVRAACCPIAGKPCGQSRFGNTGPS